MARILLTDVSSYKAVVIARFLRSHYPKLELFTTDTRTYTKILRSKFAQHHTVLPAEPNLYIERLAALVVEENITHILPVNSDEIRLLLPHRARFGTTLDYLGSDETFATLDRKDEFYRYCQTLGIRVPRCFATAAEASFPCVVKPVSESSSRGVEYLPDRAALDACLARRAGEKLIMQEYIVGTGCGYSGFTCAGALLAGYGHRRLAEYPVSGGSSVWRTGFDAPVMKRIAEQLTQSLQWSGFVMFEFKHLPDGEFCLIECNPRLWGSIHQGLANGCNYFAPLLGDVAMPHKKRDTYLSPLLYLSLLGYARNRRISTAFAFARMFPHLTPDVNPLTDPLAYAAMLLR